MDQFMLVKVEQADKALAPEKADVYESPGQAPPLSMARSQQEDAKAELSTEESSVQLKKMSDYKTFAKGLMDVALLSANTNQLRHALEQCGPFYWLRISLLGASILLQILASTVLIKERITCRKKDYLKCVKYNAIIGVLVFLIIVVNVVISSFGGPEEDCPSEESGSGDGF
jgi:hypothetical protein